MFKRNKENLNTSNSSSAPIYQSMHIPTIVIAVIVLILIIAGGYWYNSPHNSVSDYSYHYDKYSFYTLPGTGKGYGFSVIKPNAFNAHYGVADNKIRANFIHIKGDPYKKDNYKNRIIGYLSLQSRKYPNPALKTNAYKDLIKKALQNPSSQEYNSALANTEEFVTKINLYGQKVTLGKAMPFSNASIKSYAWQLDTSIRDATYSNPLHKGKTLFILGKNGWYFFLVTAESENWQKNSAFFQKILNSATVDL